MTTQKRLLRPADAPVGSGYVANFLKATGADKSITVQPDGEHLVVKSRKGSIPENVIAAIDTNNEVVRAPNTMAQELLSGWKTAADKSGGTLFSLLSRAAGQRLAQTTGARAAQMVYN